MSKFLGCSSLQERVNAVDATLEGSLTKLIDAILDDYDKALVAIGEKVKPLNVVLAGITDPKTQVDSMKAVLQDPYISEFFVSYNTLKNFQKPLSQVAGLGAEVTSSHGDLHREGLNSKFRKIQAGAQATLDGIVENVPKKLAELGTVMANLMAATALTRPLRSDESSQQAFSRLFR